VRLVGYLKRKEIGYMHLVIVYYSVSYVFWFIMEAHTRELTWVYSCIV